MIPANELRIGNWGMQDGEPYLFDLGEKIDDWNDITNPIPLTPEILEKAGFENEEGYKTLKLAIAYKETQYPCTLQKTGDGIQVCRSGVGAITAHITSLHQLQNLYFALTNQELNIQL